MDLITAIGTALPEGARVRLIREDVVNVYASGRDLTRQDVDATRAALTGASYAEVKSWIAREGMSWLSDGVASVSFKICPTY